LGLGGHSEAMLERGASVLGVDRDPQARALAQDRLARFGERFQAVGGTYAEAAERYVREGRTFTGVLADLGVSSMQIDDEARGFGIRSTAALDLRMGDDVGESALDLIDRLEENELADVIFQYGEERLSRRIARAIKQERVAGRLLTAQNLADTVRKVVPGHQQRHPAMRTFQALRIAVNDELGQLERLLAALPQLLSAGGRAVVISFHSLEDRLVKNSFRSHVAEGRASSAAKRVTTAGEAELSANRRAGPAKLRWIIK
jgi:16S rRNA (cytosine1402-N4)-methyltransferase